MIAFDVTTTVLLWVSPRLHRVYSLSTLNAHAHTRVFLARHQTAKLMINRH